MIHVIMGSSITVLSIVAMTTILHAEEQIGFIATAVWTANTVQLVLVFVLTQHQAPLMLSAAQHIWAAHARTGVTLFVEKWRFHQIHLSNLTALQVKKLLTVILHLNLVLILEACTAVL